MTKVWESGAWVGTDDGFVVEDWTIVVDEDGTSIANWTNVSGTWAANAGGYIEQTSNAASYRGLRYTNRVPVGAGLVMEAEVRFPSAGQAGADRRLMLATAWDGTVGAATAAGPWLGLNEASEGYHFQQGDRSATTITATIATDTWYTIRNQFSGNVYTLSVDGSPVRSRVINVGTIDIDASYVGLTSYQAVAHYRNIKVWRLAGP